MPDTSPQSYKNHAKLDPLYHFLLSPVALVTVLLAGYNLYRRFTFVDAWLFVLSIVFVVCVLKVRTYALRVQDRLIRLEERLRLSSLLSEPLRSRIPELSLSQLIALRFAPDPEVPSLVEQALTNQWTSKQIKAEIQNWRPDHLRV